MDFDHLSVTASVATPSYPCGIARAELAAKELSFGSKFQYPTYRGAPEGEMSADDEVLFPGGNPGAKCKSISHRCYLRQVAFQLELTQETIYLPPGCLQGGLPAYRGAPEGEMCADDEALLHTWIT